jgi:RNA recognition motif-containing protein
MSHPKFDSQENPAEEDFNSRNRSPFSIILRDLSYFCKEDDLKQLLYHALGQDIVVYIPKSKETVPRSLLYGFAELHSYEQVNSVISQLNGKDFMGRTLR